MLLFRHFVSCENACKLIVFCCFDCFLLLSSSHRNLVKIVYIHWQLISIQLVLDLLDIYI